jgi:hypothetical protein
MVVGGSRAVRNEASEIGLAKMGETAYYVDNTFAGASDENDGFSWTRPFKTIQAALNACKAWSKVYVRAGTYNERLVISNPGIELICAGFDRVFLNDIGLPNDPVLVETLIDIQASSVKVSGLAIANYTSDKCININPSVIEVETVELAFLEITMWGPSTTVMGVTSYTGIGIYIDHGDGCDIHDCYFNGNAKAYSGITLWTNAINIKIHHNYFINFYQAAPVLTAYAIEMSEGKSASVYLNDFVYNYCSIHSYVDADTFYGHTIYFNNHYATTNVDVDVSIMRAGAHVESETPGIVVTDGFYAYTGWYSDNNHDGYADIIIDCGDVYDYHPRPSPHMYGLGTVPRIGGL